MHTSGLLQSVLSEHPEASPRPEDFDEHPGIATAMAAATDTTANTHANRRRRMDMRLFSPRTPTAVDPSSRTPSSATETG